MFVFNCVNTYGVQCGADPRERACKRSVGDREMLKKVSPRGGAAYIYTYILILIRHRACATGVLRAVAFRLCFTVGFLLLSVL